MGSPLRLGTRGSALALAQAQSVAERLEDATLVTIKTEDAAAGDKARFVRAIEQALLDGEIDAAVHSAKDLPGEMPDGLEIAAVPEREDPADALIGPVRSLDQLPEGARLGTSSLRRRAQLLALRADLEIVEVRGNVDTRLGKIGNEVDAVVLAVAGIRRLGRPCELGMSFEPEAMVPAAGQGALALQARKGDAEIAGALAALADQAASIELTAERVAVAKLGASCDTPVGVLARLDGERLRLTGFAGLPDGSEWVRDQVDGSGEDPEALGRELAERMISAGTAELLARAELQAEETAR